MPFKIGAPLERTYKIVVPEEFVGDDGDNTFTATIRQARMRDAARRAEVFAKTVRQFSDDETNVRQLWTVPELRALEAQLTMVSCDIEDENGNLLFGDRQRHNEKQFNAAWGRLPEQVADLITEKVLDMNPQWDWEREEGEE